MTHWTNVKLVVVKKWFRKRCVSRTSDARQKWKRRTNLKSYLRMSEGWRIRLSWNALSAKWSRTILIVTWCKRLCWKGMRSLKLGIFQSLHVGKMRMNQVELKGESRSCYLYFGLSHMKWQEACYHHVHRAKATTLIVADIWKSNLAQWCLLMIRVVLLLKKWE